MKKWLLVGLILVMIIAPAMAETVKVTSVTGDINFSKDYGGVASGSTKTIILHLPCTLESLNNTNNNVTITADSTTASTTIDLYVNGVLVANDTVISGGASQTWTFVDFANAGVNMSATELNITIVSVANATTSTVLKLYGNDVPIVANYSIKINEIQLSKPFVDKDFSYYSAEDKITITQDSSLNLTDVKVSIEYPKFSINRPITSYDFGSLNTSQSKTLVIKYQKKGPFVPEIRTIEGNDSYTVTMKIYSYENLTAKFEFDPTSAPWSEYFPNFEYDLVKEITLNGKNVSWERGSILIPSLELTKGYNTLNITYEKPMPSITVMEVEKPWYEKTYILPVWMWILIAVAVVIIYCYYSRRKR